MLEGATSSMASTKVGVYFARAATPLKPELATLRRGARGGSPCASFSAWAFISQTPDLGSDLLGEVLGATMWKVRGKLARRSGAVLRTLVMRFPSLPSTLSWGGALRGRGGEVKFRSGWLSVSAMISLLESNGALA